MTVDIKALMNRVKGLTWYDVNIELYEPLRFKGPVPYDIKINGDMATFTILAGTHVEAECKAWDYIRSLG